MDRPSPITLVRYDAMCHAIAECYEVDEVKDIRDRALAFETYAKQAKNIEAERRACEIRLRAERKAGEILKESEKNKGARGVGVSSRDTSAPTLEEMGVSHDQSSKWQKLADVPEEDFEAALAGPDKPSTNSIIVPKQKPMDEDALWLWGRLRDFERRGVLDLDQTNLMAEMTDAMRSDCLRLAEPVTEWLKGFYDDQK